MDELIKTFHIDLKLLIAQLVNFAIVLLVLYRFAYRPILKLLNERTEKIEKGVADAEKAAQKVGEIEKEEKKVLAEARAAAQKIIDEAAKVADENRKVAFDEAAKKAEEIILAAERKIEEEKNKMLKEVKGEVAELVALATEKLIKEKVDGAKDKELIEEAIKKQ